MPRHFDSYDAGLIRLIRHYAFDSFDATPRYIINAADYFSDYFIYACRAARFDAAYAAIAAY